jgi:hypothetical protein
MSSPLSSVSAIEPKYHRKALWMHSYSDSVEVGTVDLQLKHRQSQRSDPPPSQRCHTSPPGNVQ